MAPRGAWNAVAVPSHLPEEAPHPEPNPGPHGEPLVQVHSLFSQQRRSPGTSPWAGSMDDNSHNVSLKKSLESIFIPISFSGMI